MGAPKGNKFAAGNPGGGRKTIYQKEYAEQAFKYALLGADDEQIAELLEVSVTTINRWKLAHKEFKKALYDGKIKADAEIAHSLYQRAKGYSHKDTDIRVVDGVIVQTEITKIYPPDTAAAKVWLHNRQAKIWKDKQIVEGTITGQIHLHIDEQDAQIGNEQQ